ncbi:MAG: hypothetical protein A2096_05300 [Spirochaetes bacterium GWF1_41_5]|nr:MAG: hypothetical protein A2096_05300 [Spirochaetes bacterium GWF1_41_5]
MPIKQQELVEFIAKRLVDRPEQVTINVVEGENTNIIELQVADEDYGKIIGRKGRIVNAIRILLSVCSREERKRWMLDVPDKKNRDRQDS